MDCLYVYFYCQKKFELGWFQIWFLILIFSPTDAKAILIEAALIINNKIIFYIDYYPNNN